VRYNCPPNRSSIEPLTNDKPKLRRKINSLTAGGYTAGHLGVAWSYYTLSENWGDLWKGPSRPEPYSTDTKKIVILMTDGAFNTFYHGTTEAGNPDSPTGNQSALNSDTLARQLCTNMKSSKKGAPGIEIYSIAFLAPANAEATLRACANPDTDTQQYYFSADNGEELRNAFRTVASNIGRLRIAK